MFRLQQRPLRGLLADPFGRSARAIELDGDHIRITRRGQVASMSLQSLASAPSVIDGDTIEIHGQRFRLSGIDAPESKQLCSDAKGKAYRCGQAAANALAAFIGRQTVTCAKLDIDRYQRIVAECSVAGGDVGRFMVASGLAVAYRKYSTAYVPDEEAAQISQTGIWSGTFEMPWDWRKAH